jgi:membrane protein YqaA with SNARE-associated domain
MFYTKQEQGSRCTIWFQMNGWASIAGGLISYAIGHEHSAVKPWQLVRTILREKKFSFVRTKNSNQYWIRLLTPKLADIPDLWCHNNCLGHHCAYILARFAN